jgi:tricarballylate dehydrogenase
LKQPGLYAWQVFDQKVVDLMRSEYRIPRITKEVADTMEGLAEKIANSDTPVDAKRFLETVAEFNAAVRADIPFSPNVHDGRRTEGLAIDKSNWANALDEPPFHAYAVTTGITFTFGGLKVSAEAEIESNAGKPIPGLYAAGELVGGLYYHNYASGTGLMAGAVFGRIAGRAAAAYAKG